MTDQQTTTTPDHDNTTLQQHATAIIQTAAKDVGGVYIRSHFGPDGHQPAESDVQHIAALISTARITVDWPGSTTPTRECSALCPIKDDRDHLTAELADVLHDLQVAVGRTYTTAPSAAIEAVRRIGVAERHRDQARAELASAQQQHAQAKAHWDTLLDKARADRRADAAELTRLTHRIVELEQLRDRLTATVAAADNERDQLAKILAEILHPDVMITIGDGYRTNWTPRETVQRWRSALTAAGLGSPPSRAQEDEQDPGPTNAVEQATNAEADDHATVARELLHLGTIPPAERAYNTPAAEVIAAGIGHAVLALVDVVGQLAPQPEPAVDVDLDELLTAAQIELQTATNDEERAEIVSGVLAGWFAGWPDTAVTDPYDPIAAELVRLLTPPRRQTDDQLAAIVTQALLPWSTGPYGDLALPAARAAGIAVTALAGAQAFVDEHVPEQGSVPEPWRPVIEAAITWRVGKEPAPGAARDLVTAVDELLRTWPGVDLSVPAVSIAEVHAEGQESARGIAAVPPANDWPLPVVEVEQAEALGLVVRPESPVAIVDRRHAVAAYHWGRAWDPSDIEARCPCPKAPCGYIVQGQESEECDQHYGGRKTMRGGHLADRCPGARS